MAVRKRSAVLIATLCLLSIASGAVTPADAQKEVAENMGQQDKAFKMSPQDKSFGNNKFDESDKFNAPKNVPAGTNLEAEKPDAKAEDPSVIEDYNPNRLGVSAEDAAVEQGDRKKPVKEVPHSEETTPDASDPKAGLSTGKGKNSGGVGAGSDSTTPDNVRADAPLIDTPGRPVVAEHDKDPEEIGSGGYFIMSFTMILMSEIGDKTFLVAALMGMRHNPWFVYSSSFAALAIMTVLSAILGTILPALLSKKFTTLLAAVLFVVFGANLLREGLTMDPKGHVEEEMHEVEQEIELQEQSSAQDDLEKGAGSKHKSGTASSKLSQAAEGISNLAGLVFSPLWVQIFLMTFLGEWGDRSQIATVALSAGGHFWDVCLGALAGHALCTLGAVFAGYFVATHLSMRTITLAGAAGFFVFGVLYLYEGLYAQ